jgi:hypothetical protein
MMGSRFLLKVVLGFLICVTILKIRIGDRFEIINNFEIETIMSLTLYYFLKDLVKYDKYY